MSEPKVLVGYSPDDRGDDALALAALLVRTAKTPLTVANVHAPAWPARGPGSVDAEWVAYLKEQARAALDQAGERLAEAKVPKKNVEYVTDAHRGSGRGLIEVARQTGAGLIVIGSAPRGRGGKIAIGSTADQLLHGSPVPVMLAPRGYAEEAPGKFERLTVAYWRRRDADVSLAAAVTVADTLKVPVRLLTLVLRPPGLTAKFRGKNGVMERQVEQAERDLARAAELVSPRMPVQTEVAEGAGVHKALGAADWLPGEVMACMSSTEGPLRKVFLGDTSGKIVRAAQCPVVVLPRGTSSQVR